MPRQTRSSQNVRTARPTRQRRVANYVDLDRTMDLEHFSSEEEDDDSEMDDFIDDDDDTEYLDDDNNGSVVVITSPLFTERRPRRRRRRNESDSEVELLDELAELHDRTPTPPSRPARRRARLDETMAPETPGTSSAQNDTDPPTSSVLHNIRRIDSDDEDSGPKPVKRNHTTTDPEPSTDSCGFNDIQNEDDDGCTICFEEFTTSGEHRLVSLKCGHFFGKSCIERWIRGERVSQCPQCKTKANLKDVRLHYARTIKMTDNGELELLKKGRDDYKRLSESLEVDVARLQKTVKDLEERLQQSGNSRLVVEMKSRGMLKLLSENKREFSIEGCKGIDFDGDALYVGIKRNNGGLFDQYCFVKLSIQLKQDTIVPLHQNKIRSISICPTQTNLILTVSEDATAIVFDTTAKRRLHTYKLGMSGWTGCWLSDTLIAVGLQNGRVLRFDLTLPLHQQPEDLTEGQGNIAIQHLCLFDDPQLLLIGSLRGVSARHRERRVALLDHNNDGFHKLSCVSSHPPSRSFVVTIPGVRESRQTTVHRLYRLEEEGALVKCVEVRRFSSKSIDLPFIYSSSLFSFGDSLISLSFEPDFKRLAVYDWSETYKESFCGMPNVGHVAAIRAYPIDEKEMKIVVVAEHGAFTIKLKHVSV